MTIKKKVRKESAFRCRVLFFCVLFMGHLVSIIVYRDKKIGKIARIKTKHMV